MLYLGIDQHRNQLTVDLGNEHGALVKHRQVSTAPKQLEGFLSWLRELSESEGGFAAIVEVCGFNEYQMKMLDYYGCREIVLIQPQQRSRRKTDRRDAAFIETEDQSRQQDPSHLAEAKPPARLSHQVN